MIPAPLRFTVVALLWLGRALPATAHEGPPYPIVMDERAGPYLVSVWADPDVGTGTFFIVLDPPPGAELPASTVVWVGVEPLSGRLPLAWHAAEHQPLRDRERYIAEVPFDAQEMWRVRVRVEGAEGAGEVSAEVEATPPGFGRWDLLLYLFPFVLLGGLWLYGALCKGKHTAPAPEQQQLAVVTIPNHPDGSNTI
jgi:hypothetical protein